MSSIKNQGFCFENKTKAKKKKIAPIKNKDSAKNIHLGR